MSNHSSSFKSVAVLGPGLLGGSVIKATDARLPKCEVRIWARRLEVLAHPVVKGIASVASDQMAEVVAGAELVILAAPIQHMKSMVEQFPPLAKNTVVTDVGSTKTSVVNQLTPMVADLGGEFIGSHPMAGSDKTGIDNANADLFTDASIVLTAEDSEADNTIRLQRFWEALGGNVFFTNPQHHDEVVAAISHLPHLVASALVRSSLNERPELFYQLASSGIRDTTRIASGDVDMWTEIMMANQISLLDELSRSIDELEQWKQALATLDKDQLHQFLSEAKICRDKLK